MAQLWSTWLWISVLCFIITSATCDPCRDDVLDQCMRAESSSYWTCTVVCISEDQLPATEQQEDSSEDEDSSSSSTSRTSRSDRAADRDCAQCTCECALQWPRMTTTCSGIITQCPSLSTTSSIPQPDTLSLPANSTSDSNVVAPVLITLAVIVVLINVMGGALFVAIKLRKHRRRRTETLPPWPQDTHVIQSGLHNPVYGVEELVSSPTTPTVFTTPTTPTSPPPVYEEVDVSITYCSEFEDEPEKQVHNPLYSDVTHTPAAPQVPPRSKSQNRRTSGPTAAVHTQPVRGNLYTSDGSTEPVSKAYRNQGGQKRVSRGEHKTYPISTEIPAQDYSKLDPSNQYACLEPHRGGKLTKMITAPPSVDEYSHLEH